MKLFTITFIPLVQAIAIGTCFSAPAHADEHLLQCAAAEPQAGNGVEWRIIRRPGSACDLLIIYPNLNPDFTRRDKPAEK